MELTEAKSGAKAWVEAQKPICVKCRWHTLRPSYPSYTDVCLNEAFCEMDYVTGGRFVKQCCDLNCKGNCTKFEEKPPEPPKRGWLATLFGSDKTKE